MFTFSKGAIEVQKQLGPGEEGGGEWSAAGSPAPARTSSIEHVLGGGAEAWLPLGHRQRC